jgi:hypothetical protein
MTVSDTHNAPEFKHATDMEWEMGRFGKCHQIPVSPATGTSDRAECGISQIRAGGVFPGAPARLRAGLVHHRGRIHVCRKALRPGTIAYMADPHFEHEMHTATGGTIFFVQYPGPTTGALPIYDGRMNLKEAPPLAQQDLHH